MPPTEAEVKSEFGNCIKIFDDFRKYVGVTATTLLTRIDTYIQSLEGDYSPQAAAEINRLRAILNAGIQGCGSAFFPQLLHYGQIIGCPETDSANIRKRLRQYMIDNSYRVQSRVMTFGSVSASGSPVGTGVINRLTVDAYNQNIENCFGDVKTIRCIGDEHSGATEHEERFEILGDDPAADDLLRGGSGKTGEIRGISGRDTLARLQNPSFDIFTGSVGSVTAFSGWTVGSDIANFDANTTYYRDFKGVSTPYSLKIQGNDYLQQNLNNRNAQFNPDVPVYFQIAYNREVGSGNGVLRLTLGGKTFEVVLAAQTGWNILRFSGHHCWFRNWNAEDPVVKIALAGRTSGYVLVDDIILAPYQNFDGLWYAPVGGATPWLREDKYTVTDSAAETGIIQHWWWRAFDDYLPHANGSGLTWSDP